MLVSLELKESHNWLNLIVGLLVRILIKFVSHFDYGNSILFHIYIGLLISIRLLEGIGYSNRNVFGSCEFWLWRPSERY